MQALLELPTPSNSAASLRKLYDIIESHIRGLQSLGKTKETFGDFLIPLYLGNFPQWLDEILHMSTHLMNGTSMSYLVLLRRRLQFLSRVWKVKEMAFDPL